MSSKYVRDMVKGWAAQSTVPFYDTINRNQNPRDNIWFTIEFEVETSELQSFCGVNTEEGVIEMIFCGLPGQGDGAVLAAAEAEALRMMSNSDPTGLLFLKRPMPPEEFSAGDADSSYRVVVGIEYVHSY